MTERRHPLTNDDIEKLAENITAKMVCKHGCPFTADDKSQLRGLIGIKKGSIKLVVWAGAALLLLALKDIYDFGKYIMEHLTITKI